MSGLFHLRQMPKLNLHRDTDIEDVYKAIDADKEEEKKKALLTDLRAQEIADAIIGKAKNRSIFDEIDEEIREDIRQEIISEKKSKKIFNFRKWLWKIGF